MLGTELCTPREGAKQVLLEDRPSRHPRENAWTVSLEHRGRQEYQLWELMLSDLGLICLSRYNGEGSETGNYNNVCWPSDLSQESAKASRSATTPFLSTIHETSVSLAVMLGNMRKETKNGSSPQI